MVYLPSCSKRMSMTSGWATRVTTPRLSYSDFYLEVLYESETTHNMQLHGNLSDQ